MIQIVHNTHGAGQLLARELGGGGAAWTQFLKKDRAQQRRTGSGWVQFLLQGKTPMYREGDLYRFVTAQRGGRVSIRRSKFWCKAQVRASYTRDGELGVALVAPGIKPGDTWLSREQALDLALDLLHIARGIKGLKLDVLTETIMADEVAALARDSMFDLVLEEDVRAAAGAPRALAALLGPASRIGGAHA